MRSVYTYSDYRAFIRDSLEEKREKNGGFSLRAAARKLGIGSGTLSRILNGTRNPGPALLPRFIEFLGLRRREADYFRLLLRFERAANDSEKRELYREILDMRGTMEHVVPPQRYRLFEKWYFAALHQLIRIHPSLDNPARLGDLLDPPLSAFKTRKALRILEESGFIRKEEKGYCSLEPFLTTGEKWQSTAIENFQIEMAELGRTAVERVERSRRDISTLTLSLSPEAFAEIRSIIRRTRREILAVEEADKNQTAVYQMNMHLFPLSLECEEGGSNENPS